MSGWGWQIFVKESQNIRRLFGKFKILLYKVDTPKITLFMLSLVYSKTNNDQEIQVSSNLCMSDML